VANNVPTHGQIVKTKTRTLENSRLPCFTAIQLRIESTSCPQDTTCYAQGLGKKCLAPRQRVLSSSHFALIGKTAGRVARASLNRLVVGKGSQRKSHLGMCRSDERLPTFHAVFSGHSSLAVINAGFMGNPSLDGGRRALS
jgi:hypothetical protein